LVLKSISNGEASIRRSSILVNWSVGIGGFVSGGFIRSLSTELVSGGINIGGSHGIEGTRTDRSDSLRGDRFSRDWYRGICFQVIGVMGIGIFKSVLGSIRIEGISTRRGEKGWYPWESLSKENCR